MKGKIKQYNKDRKFGFILTEQGDDIFFHISALDLSKNNKETDLIIGQQVEFKKVKEKRGFAARKINIIRPKDNRPIMENFFYNSSPEPKRGVVKLRIPFFTREFASISELKNHIFSNAQKNKCNAVLNFKIKKNKKHSGNYIYHTYSATGDFCIVINKGKDKEFNKKINTHQVKTDIENFIQQEQDHIQSEKTTNSFLIIIAGVIFLVFLMALAS